MCIKIKSKQHLGKTSIRYFEIYNRKSKYEIQNKSASNTTI